MANRKALVVAINDYPGTENDLPSCVDDAKGVTELLQSEPYGFQEVRSFLDGEATIKTVTEGLNWLFGENGQGEGTQVIPDDRLVFYYSGHGFRTEKDGVLRECLCLYDGFFFDEQLNKQTPTLIEPPNAQGLRSRSFLTLQPISQPSAEAPPASSAPDGATSGPGKGFQPSATPGQVSPTNHMTNQGDQPMNSTTSAYPMSDSDAKMLQAVLPAILPSILQYRTKDFQANTSGVGTGQDPELDEKVWGQIIAAAITAAPGIYQAIRRKDFQPTAEPATSQAPVVDEKLWPAVIAAAISAAPSIYRAIRRKDFQSAPAAEMATPQADGVDEKVLHILPAILPSVLQAYRNKGFQAGDSGVAASQAAVEDEKVWGQIIAAAITAAPGIINAVRGKEVQLDTPETTSSQPPVVDEKMMHFLPVILPSILQAVRRKDFQPGEQASAVGVATTQTPVNDEKFWGQVIAAAITAAPGIYQAVRGKEAQLSH